MVLGEVVALGFCCSSPRGLAIGQQTEGHALVNKHDGFYFVKEREDRVYRLTWFLLVYTHA